MVSNASLQFSYFLFCCRGVEVIRALVSSADGCRGCVPLVGWVRRIATISRRIVVATFLIYNLDAMPIVRIACFARRARVFGWLLCPACRVCISAPSQTPPYRLGMVRAVEADSQPRLFGRLFAPPRVSGQPGRLKSISCSVNAATAKTASPRAPVGESRAKKFAHTRSRRAPRS